MLLEFFHLVAGMHTMRVWLLQPVLRGPCRVLPQTGLDSRGPSVMRINPVFQRLHAAMEKLTIAVEIKGPPRQVLANRLGWDTGSITGQEAS
jgi:hypothetical protein